MDRCILIGLLKESNSGIQNNEIMRLKQQVQCGFVLPWTGTVKRVREVSMNILKKVIGRMIKRYPSSLCHFSYFSFLQKSN